MRPLKPGAPDNASRRTVAVLLILLLTGSLALRVWLGSTGLDYKAFMDEKYTLMNVVELLDGGLRPVWAWYPSLSYLPPAAVLAVAERLVEWAGREDLKLRRGKVLTPAGFLICRALQALYGTLSLWLVFLVGRRLFGAGVGLVAALILSSVAAHIRLSAWIKPDILLLVTLLLAFLAALKVFEMPSWRNYLLGGAVVGLAISSKQYGITAFLPLAVASLAHVRTRRVEWLRLAGAGLAAIAVFVLLNPHLDLLLDFARRNLLIYEGRGEGRLAVAATAFGSVLEMTRARPVVGVLALAGLALLGARALKPSGDREARVPAAMILVFVAGHVAFCVIATTYARSALFLPLAPFTALAAAWLLQTLVTKAQSLTGRTLPSGLLTAGGFLFAIWILTPAVRTVYDLRVVTTYDRAAEVITERLPAPLAARVLILEREDGDPHLAPLSGRRSPMARRAVAELATLEPAELHFADALVVPSARLEAPVAQRYRRLLRRARDRVEIEPRLLRSRGPALTVLLKPWRDARPEASVLLERSRADPNLFEAELESAEGARPGALVSAAFWLHRANAGPGRAALSLGERPIPFYWVRWFRGSDLYLTRRFRIPEEGGRLRLRVAEGRKERERSLQLRFWKPARRSGGRETGGDAPRNR